jgi:hypothetical protein
MTSNNSEDDSSSIHTNDEMGETDVDRTNLSRLNILPEDPDIQDIGIVRRGSSTRSHQNSSPRTPPTINRYSFEQATLAHLLKCISVKEDDSSITTAKKNIDAFFEVFPDYHQTISGILLDKLATQYVFHLQNPSSSTILQIGITIGQLKVNLRI